MPSVVKNTINTGIQTPGKVPGTTSFYDPVNNITVIQNTNNKLIRTVSHGKIKQ